MKKRLFAFLTALMLVISLCPAPAQAVSSAPSGYTAITTAQQLSDIRNTHGHQQQISRVRCYRADSCANVRICQFQRF